MGNDQWELVAELHGMQYAHCCHTACSIKKKSYRLANSQPGTGNPNMPSTTLMAKEICEAINVEVGVTLSLNFLYISWTCSRE
jgi:hypothetical protein